MLCQKWMFFAKRIIMVELQRSVVWLIFVSVFAAGTLASRPGFSTDSTSCDIIRNVSQELRGGSVFPPNGLPTFYQKYTEAYGIPVLAHSSVPDDALQRACYVVRFLLADHSGVREGVYRMSGRVSIVGIEQQMTDIPEYSNFGVYWNGRTRAMAGTEMNPVSSAAEENLLCYRNDRYAREDIMLHEFAHTLAMLGAQYVMKGWYKRLKEEYKKSKKKGKWKNTHAMENYDEYFAEGVQSYFDSNAASDPPDGVHNKININYFLKHYDPALYALIEEAFPCKNKYLKRCPGDRQAELEQKLKMNCNLKAGWSFGIGSATCKDGKRQCMFYAFLGYCKEHAAFMKKECSRSCNLCNVTRLKPKAKLEKGCKDLNDNCRELSQNDGCGKNYKYMETNCRRTCEICLSSCKDHTKYCPGWAESGECKHNPKYMLVYFGIAAASRPGSSSVLHTCDHVRFVPQNLRNGSIFPPTGLSAYYKKYTQAYRIPIIAHSTVPDEALQRACYVVRFMLADHSEVREGVYRMGGRVAVIGKQQRMTEIPEYSHVSEFWNMRTRGVGGTENNPVSSAAEENLLCYNKDRYAAEDTMLHEFAHTMATLAIQFVIKGWYRRLQEHFESTQKLGLWEKTYAMKSHDEYFAEGVQSYFNANGFSDPANGVHNHVNTNAKLKTYDQGLYVLIEEVFPCANKYLQRCESDRRTEHQQDIRMNCNREVGWKFVNETGTCKDKKTGCMYYAFTGYCKEHRDFMMKLCPRSCDLCNAKTHKNRPTVEKDCKDTNVQCKTWVKQGGCEENKKYVHWNCRKSCKLCIPICEDRNKSCEGWARRGECKKNPNYMLVYCKKSCRVCQ